MQRTNNESGRPGLRTTTAALALALGLAAAGCATTQGGAASGGRGRVRGTTMPSRAALAAVARAPATPARDATPVAPVERWELAGPFPETVGHRAATDTDPMTALLRDVAGRTDGRVAVTAAMQCAARELARFDVAHDGSAPRPFEEFVLGRCGAISAGAMRWTLAGEVPAAVPQDALVARFRERRDALDAALRTVAGPVDAGIALARTNDRALLLVAIARRQVTLDDASPTPDARGEVVFAGRLAVPAQALLARVNQGAHGVTGCALDPGVRLPRFRATCRVHPGDATTWVAFSAIPPGRMLGHEVLAAMVGAGRGAANTFTPPPSAPAERAAQPPAQTLVAMLNETRRAAGLEPVALAPRESATMCAVAPAFLAAERGDRGSEVADTVALGLMAGWDVDGLIRDASFVAGAGAPSRDLGHWLAWSLARPSGRATLLRRSARQVAVCPVTDAAQGVTGVLWSAYDLYRDDEIGDEVRKLLERLARQRAQRGLPPPRRAAPLEDAAVWAARRFAQEELPLDAAPGAMARRASEATERAVRAFVVEASEPEDVEFPEALVAAPRVDIGLRVVHWRPPGAPWGRMLVLAVAAD